MDEVCASQSSPCLREIKSLILFDSMENFITGYPGHEHEHRASMLKVLGKEKYEFFFDKWLEYFFTDKDAEFFASKGLNCLRLPFNYRHLEDDMNPRVLKEEGFKHLDRVVDLVCQDVLSEKRTREVERRTTRETNRIAKTVCQAQDLHHPRHAHCSRRSKRRLAL